MITRYKDSEDDFCQEDINGDKVDYEDFEQLKKENEKLRQDGIDITKGRDVFEGIALELKKENEELKEKIEKQKEVLSDLHIDTRYIGESMTKVSIRLDELLKDKELLIVNQCTKSSIVSDGGHQIKGESNDHMENRTVP